MMAEADEDQSGEIDFKEFCMLMGRRQQENEQDEELIEVFKIFDKDCLTRTKLKIQRKRSQMPCCTTYVEKV